jgi:hypothetical protein
MLNKYFTEDDISSYTMGDTSEIDGVLKTNISGIFGAPYQFLPDVDERISGSDIGAIYAEKIIARMPLLFLTPCRQLFMEDFNGTDKEKVLSDLLRVGGAIDSVSGTGRYYTTEFAYDDYYKYVNTMMTELSRFAGVGDQVITLGGNVNKKIKDINWQNACNSSFKNYFAASYATVYYVDGLTSMSESFSNSTTESSLASTINGYGDQANEIKFLLGKNSAVGSLYETARDSVSGALSGLSGSVSNLAGGMLGDLANTGVSNVLTGGKIIFPKIWQDSGFSRSYSFDIKLRSPDHDSTSIFMNVLAPYIHLLCNVLPVGTYDNPNVYKAPFLCKAYCKGLFNIDMGIITDMSVTRGAECQWNDDGLPTQIDISITIEDLYSSLYMTNLSDTNYANFALEVTKNTAMLDFLSNMAGLNVADQELGRRIAMMGYLTTSNLSRIPSSLWNKFDTGISNAVRKIYKILN